MRSVSRLTKQDRQRRLWLKTDRALIAGLTKIHEADQAESEVFTAHLDCLILETIPIETLKLVHRACHPRG